MLPTPVSTWRSENKSSSLFSAGRYMGDCTNGLWLNGNWEDGCMTGGAQCPLTQPQQKALHVQSHVALLVTEPQFREVLPWSHLKKQVLSFFLLT